MRISLVIAVRNGEAFLADAIDSALAQTVPPDEIVVVDDGSVDATWDVVCSYGTAVTAVRAAHHHVSAALNDGIRRTTGELLAILDADDLWRPQKLARQHDTLAADPGLDAVFVHVQQFLDPGAPANVATRYVVPSTPQPGISKTAMLIRREAMERVGLFDEASSTDFVEWWSRAVAAGIRWVMLDDVLADRRVHGRNSGITDRTAQLDADLDVLKAMLDRRRIDTAPGR